MPYFKTDGKLGISLFSLMTIHFITYNKQLLDEIEHDIYCSKLSKPRYPGMCYLLKPKAEVDNTDTRF